MRISFTLDVEDHRAVPDDLPRHVDATHAVLEFLGERGIRGTFFVVGQVIEEFPGLVKEIAAEDHEVGVHGHRHVPLPELDPAAFRAALAETCGRVEDLVQRRPVGFRAPMFSLVAASSWAVDVLSELGFVYSSSVMPIHHPLHGDPELPSGPFRWPTGLVELPCPVVQVGPLGLPWLGAVWLRNLPWPVIRGGLAVTRSRLPLLWTYAHPYDFDPEEPFRVLPEAGRVGSHLIWRKRKRMFADLDRLLHRRIGPPLAECVDALAGPLPTFSWPTEGRRG
jgi:polysaccharide deacetylase family protein (PEP-CTERM system associated)